MLKFKHILKALNIYFPTLVLWMSYIYICHICHICIWIFFFKVYSFILRERARAWAGEGQRERENLKQALHSQCRAQCGVRTPEPWGHGLRWNQVRHLTDWATHIPQECHILYPFIYVYPLTHFVYFTTFMFFFFCFTSILVL